MNCNVCNICQSADNEAQFLVCDMCGGGTHLYCMQPPLEPQDIPQGDWICSDCTLCSKCGKQCNFEPQSSACNYSLCPDCMIEFKETNQCVMCKEDDKEESLPKILCKTCGFSLHVSCLRLDPSYQGLLVSGQEFKCLVCMFKRFPPSTKTHYEGIKQAYFEDDDRRVESLILQFLNPDAAVYKRATLLDLIRNGLLDIGCKLTFQINQKKYTGILTEDGRIKTGKAIFPSPNTWSRSVAGFSALGWDLIHIPKSGKRLSHLKWTLENSWNPEYFKEKEKKETSEDQNRFPPSNCTEIGLMKIGFSKVKLTGVDLCKMCSAIGAAETLLHCINCGEVFHYYCIESPPNIPDEKKLIWRCPNCKVCDVCHDAGSEDQLLVCDGCDAGCHTFCNEPPMNSVPTGGWLCSHCLERQGKQESPEEEQDLNDPSINEKNQNKNLISIHPNEGNPSIVNIAETEHILIEAGFDPVLLGPYPKPTTNSPGLPKFIEPLLTDCDVPITACEAGESLMCVLCRQNGSFDRLLPFDMDLWVHASCAHWSAGVRGCSSSSRNIIDFLQNDTTS